MARVFPTWSELSHLPTPLNPGEAQTLECLAALDDDWTIYVQPRIGLNQPDFVVMHPRYGICVVEVKDWAVGVYECRSSGRIDMRSKDGWLKTSEDPLRQADRYRGIIAERLVMPNDSMRAYAVVRGVVVLPQYTTAQARQLFLPSLRHQRQRSFSVFGFDTLRDDPLLVVSDRCRIIRPPIPESSLHVLRRTLSEPEVRSELRLPLVLSAAAQNIEKNPSGARIRRVRGPAGCGKSMGLIARASLLAAEGKSVLVLTFNQTLPSYLQGLANRRCRQLRANPSLITFTHFHGLCAQAVDECAQLGVKLLRRADPADSREDDLVARASEAYERGYGPRFDAVLVDEGQDFAFEWWNLLRRHVRRDDGELLLVADPMQDLYDKRAWTDEERMSGAGFSGPWTELVGSYRLPPDLTPVVAAFVSDHLPADFAPPTVPDDRLFDALPFASTVRRWVNVSGAGPLGVRLGDEVVRMLRRNPDLSPSDVVLLAPSHPVGLQAVGRIVAAGFEVQHVFALDPAEKRSRKVRFSAHAPGVKGCTVHSFKGWEARAVVLSVDGSEQSRRQAYVGLTRVKGDPRARSAFVTVVNRDPRLWEFRHRFEGAVVAS